MRGWGKGGSGKDALYYVIRYRVRFEAADRAARPQEGMQVVCVSGHPRARTVS